MGCGVGGAKERKNHTVYLVRLVPSHKGGFLADVMQRRGVELFRAPRAEGDDADVPSAKREAAHVFPSLKKKEANKLADAAKELGIIRDSSAFVSSNRNDTTDVAPAANAASEPPELTAHHDGSSSLAEVLMKQKAQREEARDALIKASKVPVYDDQDLDYLDSVEAAKREAAKATALAENSALADFKRMQSEVMTEHRGEDNSEFPEPDEPARPTNNAKQRNAKRARLLDRLKLKQSPAVDDVTNGTDGKDVRDSKEGQDEGVGGGSDESDDVPGGLFGSYDSSE